MHDDCEYQRADIIDYKMKELMRYIREWQGPAFKLTEREDEILDNIRDRVDLIRRVQKTSNRIELVKYYNALPLEHIKGLDGRQCYNHWL